MAGLCLLLLSLCCKLPLLLKSNPGEGGPGEAKERDMEEEVVSPPLVVGFSLSPDFSSLRFDLWE